MRLHDESSYLENLMNPRKFYNIFGMYIGLICAQNGLIKLNGVLVSLWMCYLGRLFSIQGNTKCISK